MTAQLQDAALDGVAAPGPRLLLADHHREIEDACQALLACATEEDCARSLVEQYRSLERAVLEHLGAEEDLILPEFALDDPASARAIRGEHAAIRETLFQIGVDVELHAVRLERLQSLVEQLHAHATREDVLMYPWAQVRLPLATKRQLFVRIGRSLRALAARRGAWAPPRG